MTLKKATVSNIKWSFIESISLKLIGLILTIILARLLTPADFGVLAVVNVFYLLTNSFIDGGLKDALIQKKDATDIDYSSVFWINLIIAFLVYIILFLFAPYIESFYDFENLAYYIRIQSICLIIDSLVIVQVIKSTKDLNLKKVAQSRVPATIISFIVGVSLAYWGYGIMSLIVQQIVGSMLYFAFLFYRVSYIPKLVIEFHALKPLYQFGLNIFFAGYLNRVYTQSMNLIYAKFYTPALLGLYTKSESLQQLPANIVVNSMVTGVYPTMVKIQDDTAALKRIYKKNIKTLFILVCAISMFFIFQAENVVLVLLGENWLGMTPFLRVVAAGGIFYPMVSLNRNILKVRNYPGLYLRLELIRKVLTVLAVVLTLQSSFVLVVAVVTTVNALMTLVDMYFSGDKINYKLREQVLDVLPFVFILGFVGVASIGVVQYFTIAPVYQLFTFTLLYVSLSSTIIYFSSQKFIKSLYIR
jgi:teichuronic acid exporter